jgi:glycine dehydrogenase
MPVSNPPTPAFLPRHLGPRSSEIEAMLSELGISSLDQLIEQAIPQGILSPRSLELPPALSEEQALERLRGYAARNQVLTSYLGYGYSDTITPPVILRNILENPGWYTAYTPYQAEISQGRLEALLVFQTMVQDLTGMEIANSSLLDEATAAAEAMSMAHRIGRGKRDVFLVSSRCHPQTLSIIQTRAAPLGIQVRVGDHREFEFDANVFAALVQYPATDGGIEDYRELTEAAHANKALVCVATDLLSLSLLEAPGSWGADIVIGNSQRLGVPMGFGGPHAAFMATREKYRRQVPGRIIGISKDSQGNPALRMALQTREQHIRRQKATSNICTAQVLLAVMAGMYGVWHGPDGLTQIAKRIHGMAAILAQALTSAGLKPVRSQYFDTLEYSCVDSATRDALVAAALTAGFNLRPSGTNGLIIALDQRTGPQQIEVLAHALGADGTFAEWSTDADLPNLGDLSRTSPFMTHPTFHLYRSETEMLRYLHRLQVKDIALDTSMIPLGSCTMKLNATTEMIPVTLRGFGGMHPCAPLDQASGYLQIFEELEAWLAEITGFDAVSLQPNAGSQGEYAGLLCIKAWQEARGETHRDVCLIPESAHGTNPASAVMAGMQVVVVRCLENGDISIEDLAEKATAYSERLAALMVTYPSTHGVFEAGIQEICEIVHHHGGQVYMDGANMNAMVGLARPAELGADVLHLNLHKTFCIPHGGGGPGVGPIGVRSHLAPYLPGDPQDTSSDGGPPVSAARWGSPSILPISWAYIAMMGGPGLTEATRIAILNANYLATRLQPHYPVLYSGNHGRVAHECIIDLRQFKPLGIEAEDIAKRLMDYGFHAPTMSFPVAGTLMIEPTESEGLKELERFCTAMIQIRAEVAEIEGGLAVDDSPLRGAPHTAQVVTAETWDRAYTRAQAAWPVPSLREFKYWPPVGRVDNAWGDRNLFCSCDAWPEEDSTS